MQTIEQRFEVIRNQREHRENEMHKLCDYKRYLLEKGVPEQDANQYVRWIWRYQIRK